MRPEVILLFVPNLEGGGAERMMVNLANQFVKNHTVDLVLATKSGPYVSLVSEKVNIVDLEISFFNPFVIYRLAKYLKYRRPISILSAMTYPNIAVLLARMFSGTSTKVIISERVAMGVQSQNSTALKEKLKPLFAKHIYKYSEGIVAISNGVAENLAEIVKFKRDKITTIYNPVITESSFSNFPKPRHPFYGEGRKVILGAGRLVPQKDFKTLIEAFHLLSEDKSLYLIILGEGPMRGELTSLVKDYDLTERVSMPGYVENISAYMQYASVFVLSSLWEGFGNVLVEAMVTGCPVVSTDCPSGPSEILEDGKYGTLVTPGDAKALGMAIYKTLIKPINTNQTQERAKDFSVDIIAKQYLNLMLSTSCSN